MTNDENDLVLSRIVAAGRQRGITRRHFMQNATATGLTAAPPQRSGPAKCPQ